MNAFDEYSGSLSYNNSAVDHEGIASVFAQPTHLLICMKSDIKPSEKYPEMFPRSITTIVLDVDGKRYEYNAKEVLALLDWWMEHRDERHMPVRTCKNVAEPPSDGTFWPAPHFTCSECGHKHVSMSYVYFCPNCGRKVVDE